MRLRACAVSTIALLTSASAAWAVPVTVTGGSLFPRPYNTDNVATLDPGVTHSFGDPTNPLDTDWSITFSGAGAQGAFDDVTSGNTTGWVWARNTVDVNGAPFYLQYTRPTTYAAGTVLVDMYRYAYGDDSGDTVYTVQAANGTPGVTQNDWLSIGSASGSGSPVSGKSRISVAALPSVVSDANTLRLEFSSTNYRTSTDQNSFAFINEVLVLPDRYERVDIVSSSASGQSLPKENAYDLDSQSNWYTISDPSDETLTLNFDGDQRVDAIVAYTYPAGYRTDFRVKDDNGNVILTVTGAPATAFAGLIPIKLDQPVTTSSLLFEFFGTQQENVGGIPEIIPLTLVPEPASLTLCAPIIALLITRRRAAC